MLQYVKTTACAGYQSLSFSLFCWSKFHLFHYLLVTRDACVPWVRTFCSRAWVRVRWAHYVLRWRISQQETEEGNPMQLHASGVSGISPVNLPGAKRTCIWECWQRGCPGRPTATISQFAYAHRLYWVSSSRFRLLVLSVWFVPNLRTCRATAAQYKLVLLLLALFSGMCQGQ